MKGDSTQESNDSHKIPDMEQNRHPWPPIAVRKKQTLSYIQITH